ncbi:MAG: sterol desaturase family protein [Prochloraceae cyanobacterium]
MINLSSVLGLFICFIGSFVFSSFLEYWLHRLMHIFPKLFPPHPRHHLKNTGQGVLGEFRDYVLGTSIVMFPAFFISWEIGLSWLLGTLSYAAFAAYAHQLQHENPKACFWMKMPVHYVHHEYNQWHHNFGLGVDWWDYVFGTYQDTNWLVEKAKDLPKKKLLQLKWI